MFLMTMERRPASWASVAGWITMTDRLAYLANKYGPLAAIAIFLVWWIATDISGNLRHIGERLDSHTAETAFYMRQMCLNTSQNETQRAGCILAHDGSR